MRKRNRGRTRTEKGRGRKRFGRDAKGTKRSLLLKKTCIVFRDCREAHLENRTMKNAKAIEGRARPVKGKEKVSGKLERRSSEEGHRVDAKAPSADEGRGKLRKATRSRKQALSRGYPNGGTRLG